MSGPDKMYASESTRGQCIVSFATPSEEYCIPYTRTDLIPDPHAIARAALEKAATAAYVVCAETRHVTLGSKAEAAILALASNPAALAEIVKGVKG
jgi:hypothetical protein